MILWACPPPCSDTPAIGQVPVSVSAVIDCCREAMPEITYNTRDYILSLATLPILGTIFLAKFTKTFFLLLLLGGYYN